MFGVQGGRCLFYGVQTLVHNFGALGKHGWPFVSPTLQNVASSLLEEKSRCLGRCTDNLGFILKILNLECLGFVKGLGDTASEPRIP